jgi:hypothetical protein
MAAYWAGIVRVIARAAATRAVNTASEQMSVRRGHLPSLQGATYAFGTWSPVRQKRFTRLPHGLFAFRLAERSSASFKTAGTPAQTSRCPGEAHRQRYSSVADKLVEHQGPTPE